MSDSDEGVRAETTRARPWIRRLSPVAIDALLIAAALADALLGLYRATALETALSVLAAAALVVRRRFPYVTLVLTVPGLFISAAVVASVVALYSVAAYTQRRSLTIAGALLVFIGYIGVTGVSEELDRFVLTLIYGAVFAIGPAALGLLAATRRQLTENVRALRESRHEERRLAASEALGRERAVLAREMHDVVSHQISLIAVVAGALQVHAPDDETRAAARSIRTLSVNTLDELRSMVTVLRLAGGDGRELAPQPGITDLAHLIERSGVEANVTIEVPDDLPTSVQRTIYRTVQEGLTNARKHAPGALVQIDLRANADSITLRMRNGAAQRPIEALPSARVGLQGLTERAEILRGTLSTRLLPTGAFELDLVIPR